VVEKTKVDACIIGRWQAIYPTVDWMLRPVEWASPLHDGLAEGIECYALEAFLFSLSFVDNIIGSTIFKEYCL